ncbi:hypothetical protein GWN42_26125 [candidate division KSB1 bacterium]|nr:hypothetical protein [candidate division KSB1 bacterium]
MLLFYVLSHPTFAQRLSFHHYTQKDGFISDGISCLFQDSRGYLWIGTDAGLSVYDGASFRNFRSTDGLALDFINCITESTIMPGTLWIGTNGGGISQLQQMLPLRFSSQRFYWTLSYPSGVGQCWHRNQ